MAGYYARHVKYFSLVGLPGSKGERFFITAIRPSSLVCNIFIASLASESWIMLQIRLHAIIWSYGLAQAGEEDLSPFMVSKRSAAVIKTWRSSLILRSCRSLMKLRELCESFVCCEYLACNLVYVYVSQQMFTWLENILAVGGNPITLFRVLSPWSMFSFHNFGEVFFRSI